MIKKLLHHCIHNYRMIETVKGEIAEIIGKYYDTHHPSVTDVTVYRGSYFAQFDRIMCFPSSRIA